MAGMTQPAPAGFPVTTALELQGMAVERDLGVAFGLVVRSMGAVKSIGAGFKALRQGEVTQYTELLEDSRRHAIDRMIENARLNRDWNNEAEKSSVLNMLQQARAVYLGLEK